MKTHLHLYSDDDTEEEEPQMPFWMAILLLAGSTVAVSFSADYLVSSIQDVVKNSPLTQTFVGLILLPIVGNAAEVNFI